MLRKLWTRMPVNEIDLRDVTDIETDSLDRTTITFCQQDGRTIRITADAYNIEVIDQAVEQPLASHPDADDDIPF